MLHMLRTGQEGLVSSWNWQIPLLHNDACEELKALRKKKAAIENEALIEAFMKSGKTLEEVISFLGTEDKSEDNEENSRPRRRGRRKKGQVWVELKEEVDVVGIYRDE